MTSEEWDAISILLDKGFKWREPFGEVQASVYRTLLDGFEAAEVMMVIRMLVARGQVFGPTPGEIAELTRRDPDRPTFEEAERLIFGRGGVMSARIAAGAEFSTEAQMISARDDARQARAWEVSPLIGAFVETFGAGRLRALELDHPEYGEANRKRLREAWDRFVVAQEGREVHAIASGRRGELGRPDLLAAIPGAARRLSRGV